MVITTLCLALAVSCDDESSGPTGDPCVTCTDGFYEGETDGGGAVSFTISGAHLAGAFVILAQGSCGPLPFTLDHVYVDGDELRSDMSGDAVVEITGSFTSATTADGSYVVDWPVGDATPCTGSGSWSVTLSP